MTEHGIGARVPRKEDKRLLEGRGKYVGDLARVGLFEVALVRSPIAHAKIIKIHKPEGAEDRVLTAADLSRMAPFRLSTKLPNHRVSDYPPIATDRVRYVGDIIAACLAPTRAEAEDLALSVVADLDPLDPVPDMQTALSDTAPILHEDWADNVALRVELGLDRKPPANAPVVIRQTARMNRQAINPMEGLASLAEWDDHAGQLVIHSSTQVPHLVRTAVCELLALDQANVRVIAPDVGGGFGYKSTVQAEEVIIAALALKTGHSVRYVQDRQEHLASAANAREAEFQITLHADRKGKIHTLEMDMIFDAGAYAVYPHANVLDAAMAVVNLPGPYVYEAVRIRSRAIATNKPPIMPFRGVARPGVCLALELAIDALAAEVGLEPSQVRLINLIRSEQLPYTSLTGMVYDSGDYSAALQRAVQLIDLDKIRTRQHVGETEDGKLIGLGVACYLEQTAINTAAASRVGLPYIPGYEQARARITPDGGMEIAVGVHSHGQGMETSLAQMAHEVLGIDFGKIVVRHGDTGLSEYSTGTWASRSAVMAGGAVVEASRQLAERLAAIGAHLLQCEVAAVTVANGEIEGPNGSVTIAEVARVWHRNPEELPAGVDPGGLSVTAGYRPNPDRGPFAYATHAALVAVDTALGSVEILDYVVVEDCGTMINPLIVEGQIEGGTIQGLGNALFEESPYDDQAQPLATTFADYVMPGATESPRLRIEHMITPAPHTAFGIKGAGESAIIPAPAVIANAVNDALRPLGARISETPISPRRVLAAIAQATGD